MNRAIRIVPLALLAAIVWQWPSGWVRSEDSLKSEDPVKVAPDVYRVLLDNEHVRVLEARMHLGASSAMHSHPASVCFGLCDARVRFTLANGKTKEMSIKAGEATWHEAEDHAVENIGTTEARVLVVELKSPAKKLSEALTAVTRRIENLVPRVEGETADRTGRGSHVMFAPDDLKWRDAPPSLPPGAKLAILSGDPEHSGPFTMRLRVPAGYKVWPHWHPADEHITVIAGSCYMGVGDKFDTGVGHKLAAGSFMMMPASEHHFAWAEEESIVQIHGIGPWAIHYLNPADDPRTKSGKDTLSGERQTDSR